MIITFNPIYDSEIFRKIALTPPKHDEAQLKAYEICKGGEMSRTIHIKATKPQAEFHALKCKYALFVGGFGSGKTEAMINQAIIDASSSSSAVIALYAPTYDLVKLILMSRIQEKLSTYGIAYTPNKSDHVIYTSAPGFGDFILRTLDKPERIIGYESYRAHVDEIDTLSMDKAKNAWDKIIARNRQQLEGVENPFNRVSAYSTPEGYHFIYNRWVKNTSDMYQRVHASTHSNPHLPEDYVQSLMETYPEELISAYIEGQFVNLTGGNVYSSYDRNTHDSSEVIRDEDTLYIGCDFNVTKQAATIYVKRNGGTEWHIVRELVDMYDTPDMINIIKEQFPDHKVIIYPDASGKSRKTVNASISDIALLEQAGFEVRARDSNPRVKDRVMAMNAALSHGRIFVNVNKCPTVASCLEQQAYDKNGEPDKKSGNDHQNDATTYPIAYEMPIRKPIAHIDFSYAV